MMKLNGSKLMAALRKVTVIAVLATVAAFALNLLVDNPYSHNLARRLVNEKLKAYSGIKVDFRALKIRAVPLGIDLFGFEVTSSEDEKKSLVKASQVRVGVSFWSIVFGAPRLGVVEVTDLEFTWPLDPVLQKALGLDQPKDPTAQILWPLPYGQLPIEVLQLKNARVYVEIPADPKDQDQRPKLIAALAQLDLRLDVADLDDIEVLVNAGSVTLKSGKFNILEKAKVETEVVIAPDRIRKSPYRISTNLMETSGVLSGKMRTNARTNVLEKIDLDASIVARGDLQILGKILDIEDTSGGVEADGKLAMTVPVESEDELSFLVTADAKTKDGRIDNFRLRESQAKLEIDKDKLKITSGSIVIGDKNYGDFSGSIEFNDKIGIDFAAKPKGLPFALLMDALKVDQWKVFDTTITSPDLTLKGTGEPLRLKVSATADFDRFVLGAMKDKLPADATLPTCRNKVLLDIDAKKINFSGSQLNCFTPNPSATMRAIPPGSNAAPLDAQNASLIDLSGIATFDQKTGLDLWLKTNAIDLRLVKGIANEAMQGIASAAANIKGPYDNVGISAAINAKNAVFRQLPLGDVSSNITLTDDNLLGWRNLSLRMADGGSVLAKSGSLRLNDNLDLSTDIFASKITEASVANLMRSVGESRLSFNIPSVNGQIKGPLLKPGLYQGTVAASIANLQMNDNLYLDTLAVQIKGDQTQLTVGSIDATLKDLALTGDISVTKEAKGRSEEAFLGLRSKDSILANIAVNTVKNSSRLQYDHLQILPYVKAYASTAKISGQVSGNAMIQGTIDDLSASFRTNLSNARFLDSKIANLNVDGQFAKQQLKLTLKQSGTLDANMDINLGEAGIPYKWDIRANRMDIRALGTKFFAKEVRNFAYLSARWQMEGKFNDWWRSHGELDLQDIRLRFIQDTRSDVNTIDLALQNPLTMQISDAGWVFAGNKPLVIANELVKLQISTQGNRPPEHLKIDFESYFAVETLKSFIQDLETASGRVLVEGKLSGSVEKPRFDLRMRDDPSSGNTVSFGLSSIRPAFTNVTFDARVTEDALIVNSFNAEKGKGRMTASGQIGFGTNQLENSRIDINLLNASFLSQVALLKTFESELSGALSISGNKLPLLVAGDLQISRARSTRNFDLREQIINTLKRKTFETAAVNAAADPTVNFDLRVTADNSIAITNRNIQTVLSGNLNVGGNDIAPSISGQIEVDKGNFAYKYRRDFRITQGIITFDDPVRPDPRLDILAVSETGGYRVFMAITGRASDPRIDLSIDPPTREDGTPLTKVDILVLLSTGSLPERQRTDVATQDAAKAEALNLLVGQFEEPVEKLFDMSGQTVVQQVYIDSYAGKDGTPTARLNLPLNVHQDWDVIFRVDDTSQKLSVGYRIDESVSVSGSLDRQAKDDAAGQTSSTDPTDTGVDLKFRFSFP